VIWNYHFAFVICVIELPPTVRNQIHNCLLKILKTMHIIGCHCGDEGIAGRTQGPHACKYWQEVGVSETFVHSPCWGKAPCYLLILRIVPPLGLHFLLNLDLCEAHV